MYYNMGMSQAKVGFSLYASIGTEGGQEKLLRATGTADLELNHLNIEYGTTNVTLAWMIVSPYSGCNITRLLSFRRCEQNSPDINETVIVDTRITIPSANLSIGGELAYFSIFSLSDQESLDCPRLQEIVRFNGKQNY